MEKKVGGEKRATNTANNNCRGRLLMRLQTGCILRAVGASIYAQTHTIAMSSSLHTDNAPPAARSTSTTRGHKMDQKRYETNTLYPKGEERKKKKNSSLASFQSACDWVSVYLPPSHSFCFGGELYLERAGAVYSRPPGKGLHGPGELSKAVKPRVWGSIPTGGSHSFIHSCIHSFIHV